MASRPLRRIGWQDWVETMLIGDVFVNAMLKARDVRRDKQRESQTLRALLSVLSWEYDQWPLVLPSQTLPSAEKQVSITKVISVKEDHLVKYPDYKFPPVSQKKGRGRYIVNRDCDIIDEARRATLIGKGAEGMELGRALEVEGLFRKPSTPVTERTVTTTLRAEIPAPDDLVCDGDEDDFVPTCGTPLLDLNAPNPGLYNHIPDPPPRSAPFDPQFGFKAHVDVDNCF